MVKIRPAQESDALIWAKLRHDLWPDESGGEHREEIDRFFRGEFPRGPWAVFLAEREDRVVGFAEVSIRPFAEGCRTARVAYLEGWFVASDAREQGTGRALVEAAEQWGRAQGCVEIASDADSDNHVSRHAHLAVGFGDAGLVRCFAKQL